MTLQFLTQDDPLYILPFFEEFITCYASDFDVKRVVVLPAMGKRSRVQLLKELTQLYGPLGFLRLVFERKFKKFAGLVPKRAGTEGSYASLTQLCRAYGIAYREITDPNDPAFVEEIKALGLDVLVSVACPAILKSPLLSATKYGCVNIHHAPLPRYKGMMPSFWQMYHGEEQVGVTVHFMGTKIDEGTLVLQDSLMIEDGEVLDSLIRRSKKHGAHVMAKALRLIETGATEFSAATGEGTYFTFPTGKEIQEFKRRGYKAI
jgi:methionyl-tRNA formyltransferase